jgi:chromosome partitioning protein
LAQTIACANQKGGVGKTTTVVNLGAYLALEGERVLVVDLDPQGNATSGLGIDRSSIEHSVYDAVIGSVPLGRLIVETAIPSLHLVPSAVALAGAEVELASMAGRERRLARLLPDIAPRYDLVLVDSPPSLGLLTVNALTASDTVLIALQCEYYALEGLSQLLATVELVRDHLNPSLEVEGVVLTMHDPRTNLSAQVAADARRHLGPAVFETVIPRSVRLSEAPSFGKPIVLYAPESKGAAAYKALAREFRTRRRQADARRIVEEPRPVDIPSNGPVAAAATGRSGYSMVDV